MKTLEFPINKHLSATDQERLAAAAKSEGQSPEDFVETAIKRALFGVNASTRRRRTRKA